MDWAVVIRNFDLLWGGFKVTLRLLFFSIILAFPGGLLLGLGSISSRKWLRYPIRGYINFIRNVPLLIFVLFIYFLLPEITQHSFPRLWSAIIAFALFHVTYICEIIRAGYQSVSQEQISAGYSTGLTYWQVVHYILLPISLRRVIPSFITQAIIIFQDTTLAYVIGLREFLRMTSLVDDRVIRPLELYMFAAMVFLIICSAGSQLAKHLEARSA